MERLTQRTETGGIRYTRRNIYTEDIVEKLAEYENLEEQGLLLRLPCKAGDTIYKPNPITLSEIVEIKIESIFITESEINISGRTTKMKYSFCCSPSDFGKTVFLTKAEAEQKLKNDVCEWKVFDNSLTKEPQWVYETTCGKYIGEEHTSKAFMYCPYCSKKIKVVE